MDSFDPDRSTVVKRQSRRRQQADALPDAPPDWRSRILELLERPGLDPMDARSLRGWLAWSKLPSSYWRKVKDISNR